eukprot:CAMPEP_0196577910 /NCGR_PEP_ID=MMETSP1081-20130531/6911_1 /TAXON_ID=36882 /ORGANISM="Pyramimonas amylifera, Strain CCMP720" /LENGTH=488 /DNA_ID=CAMNT_0041896971 /DNA_START=118 /DNA_END=1581 /DNA_ORIENTATION=+
MPYVLSPKLKLRKNTKLIAHGPHFPHGSSFLTFQAYDVSPQLRLTTSLTEERSKDGSSVATVSSDVEVEEEEELELYFEEEEEEGPIPLSRSSLGMVKDIAKVGVPEMLSCMMDPLVSAVETGLVGRLGTVCLAALGPGSNLFILAAEVSTAGCICSASTVSHLQGSNPSRAQIQQLMSTAVWVAFLAGIIMSIGCVLGIGPMMGSNVNPELAGAVQMYVCIRAVGNPFFFVSTIVEGCFVGLRNSVTPLKIFAVMGGVQLGVMWAVGQTQLAGCALAAVVAQVVGFVLFMRALDKRGLWKFQRPCLALARTLLSSMGLVTMGTFARMGTYIAMTAAAASMGIVPAAAHKVAYECYYLMSFATEPMFTSANALLPQTFAQDRQAAKKLTRVLLVSSALVGLVLSVVSQIPTRLPLFSQDPLVLAQLNSISPMLAGMLMASSVVYAIEGVLIGLGDVKYLTLVHIGNFGFMCFYSFLVRHYRLGLEGMW